jgi:AraC family transcriptional activator of pobA
MAFDPTEHPDIRLITLPQLAPLGRWQIELAHDRGEHLLIWITRGQGVALIDGARRGFGTHNALFVPARQLMALDPGRQTFGLVLMMPPGLAPSLPDTPQHLRIRDATAQTDLTGQFEALDRDARAASLLHDQALQARTTLIAVWLHRQIAQAEPPEPASAARRLSRAYCARLTARFASGDRVATHATALGVSAAHLTRACLAETGRSATALLDERRLHAARLLLAATDAGVGDIARHLGFSGTPAFNRFVHRHAGAAPTALRRPPETAG